MSHFNRLDRFPFFEITETDFIGKVKSSLPEELYSAELFIFAVSVQKDRFKFPQNRFLSSFCAQLTFANALLFTCLQHRKPFQCSSVCIK